MSSTTIEVGSQDAGDGPGDGVVGAVAAHEHAEVFEAEPGDSAAGLDGGLAEGFEEHRFAGAGRSAHHQVLGSADPFQGAQGVSGWERGSTTGQGPRRRRSCRSGNRPRPGGWRLEDRSRPAISSTSRVRSTSAGSQRCARAVASTSGAVRRMWGSRMRRSSCSEVGVEGRGQGCGCGHWSSALARTRIRNDWQPTSSTRR